jgi:mRNA-degrading endonuclease RelE of RelBE toxin-antitoxin system
MDHIDKLLAFALPKHRAQIVRAMECLQDAACRTNLRIQKLSGTQSILYIHVGRYRILFQLNGGDVRFGDIRLRNEKTYRDI